jgi:hypothetical protein
LATEPAQSDVTGKDCKVLVAPSTDVAAGQRVVTLAR